MRIPTDHFAALAAFDTHRGFLIQRLNERGYAAIPRNLLSVHDVNLIAEFHYEWNYVLRERTGGTLLIVCENTKTVMHQIERHT